MTVFAGRKCRDAPEPGGSRYRLSIVRAVACVFVLLLVGCAGSSGAPRAGSAAPIDPLPTGAPVIQNSQETCTQVDLTGPPLAMPKPKPVTASIVIKTGIVARLDPAPGAVAPFSADDAWKKFAHDTPLHARTGELLLGVFSAYIPFGPSGPHNVRALSWILRLHHLAYALPAAKPAQNGSGPSTPQAVCEYVDAVLVVDATTGATVVYSY